MINYKFVVSRAALNDIFDAIEWYEDQRQGLSIDFELCLEGGYEDIKNNPWGLSINTRMFE